MSRDLIETLSAFLDGEPVEPVILAQALAAPGAREALRDFALIRSEILSDGSTPGPAFYSRMSGMLAGPAPRRRWWAAVVPVPASVLAVAAMLFLALTVWGAARWTGERKSDKPPAPDRVVLFEPGVDWESKPVSEPPTAPSVR